MVTPLIIDNEQLRRRARKRSLPIHRQARSIREGIKRVAFNAPSRSLSRNNRDKEIHGKDDEVNHPLHDRRASGSKRQRGNDER